MIAKIAFLLASFIRWWIGELAAMLPARVKRLVEGSRDTLVVALQGDHVHVQRASGRTVSDCGRIDLAPEDRARAAMAEILRSLGRQRRQITMRLPAKIALRRTVSLPLAAEENLRQVLSFEIDRLTPFKRDGAQFDYTLRQRDAAAQRIQVDLTVVPRTAVEEAVAVAGRLGLDLDAVDLAGPETGAPPSGNLLVEPRQSAELSKGRALNLALGAAAFALAVVAVYLPLERQREVAAFHADQVVLARKQADAVVKIEKEIDAALQGRSFLFNRKRQQPAVVETLTELSRLLPDDTYLIQWEMTGTTLRLSGYSASATSIIAVIEESPAFEKTEFRSAVTPDARLGRERFQISTELSRRAGQ